MSLATAQLTNAATLPPTVEVETSADGPVSVIVGPAASPHAAPRDAGNPSMRLIVTPIRMVDKANASWPDAAALIIGHAGTNDVRTVPNAINDPSDYSFAPVITWNDLVSNPDQQELWFLVRGFSTTGANDVSLAGTTVMFESLSDGGALDVTVTFTGSTYTQYAPLYMQDPNSPPVISGAASQSGQRFSVLVHIKSFDGNSQANLDSAQNWITVHMPYPMKCTAQGNADSAVWRTVSTDAPFDDGRLLVLSQMHDASGLTLSVTNAFTDRFCTIWGKGSLSAGKDQEYPDAIVYDASNSLPVPYYSPTNRFFRAQLQ